jgi:hypothetical protein
LVGASGQLTVSDSSVAGNVTAGDDGAGSSYVGGVLGTTFGSAVSITSTEVSGDIRGTERFVGGLVGWSGALTVSDSSVTGPVTAGAHNGNSYVGGVLGSTSGDAVSITSAEVSGDVTGAGSYVGGLVGTSGALTVSGSSVVGDVTAGDDNGWSYVGGVLGTTFGNSVTISTTSVEGNVLASAAGGGGLVGTSGELTVSGSSVVGNVTVGASSSNLAMAGGVVGSTSGNDLTVSTTNIQGNVTGLGNYVGGLVGQSGGLTVSSSSLIGNVTAGNNGNSYVGGLAGSVNVRPTSISSSVLIGDVVGSGATAGGLVGEANGAAVTESMVRGSVAAGSNSSGNSDAGGLVGWSPQQVSVAASAVIGNVTGSGERVGGLVGFTSDSAPTSALVVSDAFFRGIVLTSNRLGGIAGSVNGDGEIENVYVSGSRPDPAVNDQGGFVGHISAGALTTASSFCTGTDCDVGNRVDDADLKRQSTFTGWDFDTVWCLSSSVNDGYPVLRAITNPAAGFAACWAPVARPSRPSVRPSKRVTFDPNGGKCVEGDQTHEEEWTSTFRRYLHLPGSQDCEREGFEFLGWADVELPADVLDLPVLTDPTDGLERALISTNADLIAVWKEVEVELDDLTGTAPGAFVGGPDRRTREGGGVVEGYYIPPNTVFGPWMLASA